MLKLRIKDNAKGDVLNSIINKTVSIFGWPHCTLPGCTSLPSYSAPRVCTGAIMSQPAARCTHSVLFVQVLIKLIHTKLSSPKASLIVHWRHHAVSIASQQRKMQTMKPCLMLVLFSGHGITDMPLQSSSMLFTKTNTMVSSHLSTHVTSTWYMVKFQRVNYRHSKVRFSWHQTVLGVPLLLWKARSLRRSEAIAHSVILASLSVCVLSFCVHALLLLFHLLWHYIHQTSLVEVSVLVI